MIPRGQQLDAKFPLPAVRRWLYAAPALAPSSSSPARRPADLLAVLGLLAACFGVYGQTVGFGFINFDDPGYVFENPHVLGGLTGSGFRWAWTAFAQSNWHPLTWLSLMADAQLYGLNAGGYHLTNLLLHAANSALLFLWLRRATGAFWLCALTAALFAVHPLHVESVAWVSERKDVLSVFFGLLTLLAYTRYAQLGGRRRYWAAVALYALGLAAKPMLVTLPALLLLLDVWPLRRADSAWGRRWLEKGPFFALAVASAVVTFIAQRTGHSVVPYEALPLSGRFNGAVTAAGAYVGATFWPANLGVYYPYWAQRPGWQPAAAVVSLTAVSAVVWRWRRKAPYAAVGWGWFGVALLPVIGVVQVGGQAMADRYTYLPHIGLFIALVWSGAEVARRRPRLRLWLAGVAVLAVSASAALAVRQASFWRDGATLFAHTFQVTRPSVNLCLDYGDACLGARRYAEAEGAYRAGLRLHPGHPDLLSKMGLAQLLQEHWAPALASLDAVRRLRPDDDSNLCIYGRALDGLGRRDEAVLAFRAFLRIHPDSVTVHLSLANSLLGQRQLPAAAAEYDAVLALQPDDVTALYHRAWMLAFGAGDELPTEPAHALTLAQRAVRVTGGADMDSLDALAAALAANGRWPQAAEAAESAWRVAEQESAPASVIAIRRERAGLYRAGQFPRR